jgi:hypothetical protein
MMAQETAYIKAWGVFHKICAFLSTAHRDGLRLDEVERELHSRLAEEGLAFLQEYVEGAGDGDVGETVTWEERVLRRSETPQQRGYSSIFGQMGIARYVYSAGEKKRIEYAPLDARLGLPAGEVSYVLEDFQQRLSVKSPFAKGMEDLRAILGTAVSVATAERANQQMGYFAENYHLSALTEEGTPPAAEEGELIVTAADGKGVPMRRTLEERLKGEREEAEAAARAKQASASPPPEDAPCAEACRAEGTRLGGKKAWSVSGSPDASINGRSFGRAKRRKRQRCRQALRRKQARRRRRGKEADDGEDSSGRKGKRKGNKQMAYVGAVYTINRFRRTADDVLDEVSRRQRQKERPRPQHKKVWAEMTRLWEGELLEGRSLLFAELALACHYRDPERKKTWICLMDGEEALWEAQAFWLDGTVQILDFFHAMEHLWKVARVLHEGRAAEAFVEHHARMFLEGKVDYAVRNFGRLLQQQKPHGKKAAELRRAIHYFRNNRDRMHYDEYLAQGYPIGSGVAEGTCRNLVKDRLEMTGMKWEYEGAKAMIYLRALYLNGEWNPFIAYRIAEEQTRLYGKDTIYGKLTHTGQAA